MSHFSQDNLKAAAYSTKMGNLLHFAVSFGSKTTFQALLELGLDLNCQNADGNTPLHLAARLGRQEMVDCILSHPSVDDTLLNKDGKTGLDLSKTRQISSTIECKLHLNRQT
jgi:ankyrin repeat protein